ncbi:hypothetical protein J6590_056885 [Homalodisca vitripennis]|nr:hypothetical protein J6590_056885 [Homalodisca vitripennis]
MNLRGQDVIIVDYSVLFDDQHTMANRLTEGGHLSLSITISRGPRARASLSRYNARAKWNFKIRTPVSRRCRVDNILTPQWPSPVHRISIIFSAAFDKALKFELPTPSPLTRLPFYTKRLSLWTGLP